MYVAAYIVNNQVCFVVFRNEFEFGFLIPRKGSKLLLSTNSLLIFLTFWSNPHAVIVKWIEVSKYLWTVACFVNQ